MRVSNHRGKGIVCNCSTVTFIGTLSLKTQANPLLYETVWKAARMVKCPDPGFNTVYDQWLHFSSKDYNGTTKPQYVVITPLHYQYIKILVVCVSVCVCVCA